MVAGVEGERRENLSVCYDYYRDSPTTYYCSLRHEMPTIGVRAAREPTAVSYTSQLAVVAAKSGSAIGQTEQSPKMAVMRSQ